MSSPLSPQLKALERLRQQRRKQSQQRVIAQQHHVEQMRNKLNTLQHFIDSPIPTMSNGLALRNHESYVQELRRLYQWQQQQCQSAEQELAQRNAQLIASHRQEKRLEQYCQVITETKDKQQQQQIQKLNDELAAIRFSRKV
ncbi:flagellar export protein FliJ [Rosenbergiella nectarea]|uniref:Flagellar export protein FliJ n=1 Tax=Rosenbergiella nectarea TaxID=988801 RepID=A0A1H9JYF3_9GAMM|nr:flagellar FliJ family protein [Rosenbergiella nectarea]SEQ91862.1 flagellar export protein FliJ [Rosenbergiella nectarea]